MTSRPTVSIVIPMFNRQYLVGETIASLQHQTEQSWECVVVDDGSQDRSREVVLKIAKVDRRVKLFQRPAEVEKGPSGCRNFGFAQSHGEWVWFLDSDDLVAEEALSKIVDACRAESVDGIVGMYDYFNEGETSDKLKCWCFDINNAYLDHVTEKSPLLTSMPVWRRDFLQGRLNSLWNTAVQFNEDYEFYARMLAEQPSLKVLKSVIFKYRLHDDSRSVSISRGRVSVAQKAEVRLSKLDARLRVLEGLAMHTETTEQRTALAQVSRRVLVQIKRDRCHAPTHEAVNRLRAVFLKQRSLSGLGKYFMVPIILRSGRGLSLIAKSETD